jgi:iduronate 2-sulfatase
MRRREFLKALGFGAAALGVARWGRAAESATAAAPGAKPNILFIAADDLRPELGCYGVTQVKTPNIDRLASRGVVFTRAYCQQPLCNATRASLLSGLRPDSTGVFHNGTHFREKNPDVITLPQHFKNNGYVTMTIGKIFHLGKEDPISWTETLKPTTLGKPYLPKPAGGYQLPENRKLWLQRAEAARKEGLSGEQLGGRLNGPATECADVPDQAYADGVTADTAILALREHKNQPFFLAVGFLKPHLSFVAPKKYWDMYDPAKLQLARNPFPPKDCPPIALTSSIELRARTDIPKDGPIPADLARRLIHGYSACVSYVDAQVGRVLAELERCGLADNTIVVLWGDHGWQLGEHDLWGKVVNFETSARSPLIIAAPGRNGNGRQATGLVEFVDIYPTLCDLARLPLPAHLQGTSAAPLLDAPDRSWKQAAFTQSPCPAFREWAGLPLDKNMSVTFRPLMSKVERQVQAMDPDDFSVEKYNLHVTGYSMRTDRYRFVYWCDDRQPDKPVARELYDHQNDPDENVNIAADKANASLLQQLTQQWRDGWRKALPAGN